MAEIRINKIESNFFMNFPLKPFFIGLLGVLIYLNSEIWSVHFSKEILGVQFGVVLGAFILHLIFYLFSFKGISRKITFLISLIDLCLIGFYFLYIPSSLSIFIALVGLNIIFAGFFISLLESLSLVFASIFIMTLLLSFKGMLWENYTIIQYVLNSLSFLIYGVLTNFLQNFYFENKHKIKSLSKELFTQRELNNIVFNSISSSVLVHSSEEGLISENYNSKNMSLEMPGFFMNVIKDIKLKGQALGSVMVNERILSYRKSKIKDGSADVYLVSDETETFKVQEELERERKMAAIGRLSAGLAHEIRNPLAGISGSVELLKDNTLDSEDSNKLFKTVLREIDRLNHLVTDFLGFARPEIKLNEEVNIKVFLDEIVDFIKRDVRFHEVEILCECESFNLLVDSNKLKQVFLNLLVNAVQSFEKHGGVKNFEQKSKPLVQVTGALDDSVYRIKILDNGSGIEKNKINNIFEPFYTTKDKGTGLGLALSHRIIEGHNATVFVESKVGEGTTFTINFKI